MSLLTKESAYQALKEMKSLQYLHPENSAFSFETSISWHLRWMLIFELIDQVKRDHALLLPIRENIQAAIINGNTYSFTDWGGGWQWNVKAVKVKGGRNKVIHLFDNGACFYRGQHDRPVITLVD